MTRIIGISDKAIILKRR